MSACLMPLSRTPCYSLLFSSSVDVSFLLVRMQRIRLQDLAADIIFFFFIEIAVIKTSVLKFALLKFVISIISVLVASICFIIIFHPVLKIFVSFQEQMTCRSHSVVITWCCLSRSHF